jgi:hypothetical protein
MQTSFSKKSYAKSKWRRKLSQSNASSPHIDLT